MVLSPLHDFCYFTNLLSNAKSFSNTFHVNNTAIAKLEFLSTIHSNFRDLRLAALCLCSIPKGTKNCHKKLLIFLPRFHLFSNWIIYERVSFELHRIHSFPILHPITHEALYRSRLTSLLATQPSHYLRSFLMHWDPKGFDTGTQYYYRYRHQAPYQFQQPENL